MSSHPGARYATLEDALLRNGWTATPSGCWEWNGCRSDRNYGVLGYRRKQYRAHRVSYEIHVGSIPDGQVVRHTCDNPPCVNPEHLELGTHADNQADKVRRRREARGSRAGRAKLSDDQVLEVRRMWDHGLADQSRLAGLFGVNQTAISAIVLRKSWTHLPEFDCPYRCHHVTDLHAEIARLRGLLAVHEPQPREEDA